jgi:hypothetical protein
MLSKPKRLMAIQGLEYKLKSNGLRTREQKAFFLNSFFRCQDITSVQNLTDSELCELLLFLHPHGFYTRLLA